MRVLALILSCAFVAAASVRAGDDAKPAAEHERFSMTPSEGGFLRLDKETGAVSFCTVKDGLSICRAAADERAALEAEISRLSRENAELRSRVAQAPAAPHFNVPSEEDLERTLSFTERFMRRMMRLFREEAAGDRS